MVFEFKLPDVGEGLHEAEIVAIKVKEGDVVKEYAPLFDVETDKAVVELTAPVGGRIAKINFKVGDVAKVGQTLVSIENAGEAASQPISQSSLQSSSVASSSSSSSSSSSAVSQTVAGAGLTGSNGRSAGAAVADRAQSGAGPVPAAPATRRLARELGVDLKLIHGSGPAGRVMKEDIRAYAEGVPGSARLSSGSGGGSAALGSATGTSGGAAKFQAGVSSRPGSLSSRTEVGDEPGSREPLTLAPFELPDFSRFGPVERQPLRSLRRKIALNMTQSWTHVPHVAHMDKIDVTELEHYRRKHEEAVRERGGRLTMTVLAVKAIASALKKYPAFNCSLDEARSELVFKQYINIGIAVATERGLIVPVIKDADKKNLYELSAEVYEIAQKTREGKIELDRLQGGTFTITNIGAIGGTGMMPMVNYPEVAIFGMAKAKDEPVVLDGEIVVRTIMPVTMSFDHRVADGAEAAYFVKHVSQCLEDPFKLLLEV